jgi:predicted DNA-binding transcriptional regulator AlpA
MREPLDDLLSAILRERAVIDAVIGRLRGKPGEPIEPEGDRMLSAPEVRRVLGWSPRTLDRRVDDPEIGFPKPQLIRRRRYWWRSEIEAWRDARPRSKQGRQPEPPWLKQAHRARADRPDDPGDAARAPKLAPRTGYIGREEIVRELGRSGRLRYDAARAAWRQWDGERWRDLSADHVLGLVREAAQQLAKSQGRRWSGMGSYLRGVELLARADPAFAMTAQPAPELPT